MRINASFSAEDVKLALGSILDMGIFFHAAEGPLLSRAADLAFRCRMTVCDGCFIALADIRGLPLITADEKLMEKAGKQEGLARLSDAVPEASGR